MRRIRTLVLLVAVVTALITPPGAIAGSRSIGRSQDHNGKTHVRVLTSGLDGALGSTVGPDGALYLVEGVAGRIARVDPRTGRRPPSPAVSRPASRPTWGARWTSPSSTTRHMC
jgi:streptogramin lyase